MLEDILSRSSCAVVVILYFVLIFVMVAKYKRIQKKLLALKKFQEITKAIRFVAGGELGRLRKEIGKRFTALSSIVPLFSKKYLDADYTLTAVVPITDDRGSCGPHNNNVIAATSHLITFLEEHSKTLLIYALGKKGKVYFKKFYKQYFVGYGMNLHDVKYTIDNCNFIAEKLLALEAERYFIVFNRYFSTQMQKALSYQFGRFGDFAMMLLARANSNQKGTIFFDSIKNKGFADNYLADLYYFCVSLFLVDALEDNRYSFLAGRFNAMDNAIKNASDAIEKLTIIYNKARQEYITTELIEIISCKEAILTKEVKSVQTPVGYLFDMMTILTKFKQEQLNDRL